MKILEINYSMLFFVCLFGAAAWSLYRVVTLLKRSIQAAQLPQSAPSGTPKKQRILIAIQIELHGYLFCVPSAWSEELAVRNFKVFADGVLLSLEREDTAESYRQAADLKQSLEVMCFGLCKVLKDLQSDSIKASQ